MAVSSAIAGRPAQVGSASLYVGDLNPEVRETSLYDKFKDIGPVSSIRVCRDTSTKRSLCYAYVNYHAMSDAERALDNLNHTDICGTPCRIMWSHRDPALRKSGTGNIFVKNLNKSIDNRKLYDTFSTWGNILSCKVATDETGSSMGYGFVHYEDPSSADTAIEKTNGKQLEDKIVYVAHFQRKDERKGAKDPGSMKFTNIYVKNIPSGWTKEVLEDQFGRFGAVTSAVLQLDSKKRFFAFVNFQDTESAQNAVKEMNGKYGTATGIMTDEEAAEAERSARAPEGEKADKDSGDADVDEKERSDDKTKPPSPRKSDEDYKGDDPTRLYVCRAQPKAERQAYLKAKHEEQQDGKQRLKGDNLYIKNLDDSIDDAKLREMFDQFGTITSARVMVDAATEKSRGFGFVSFMTAEEATNAVAEMHLKVVNAKPLYVGLAEKREERLARLQQRHKAQQNHMRILQGGLQSTLPAQMQFPAPHQIYGGYPASTTMPSPHPSRTPQMLYTPGWRPQESRPPYAHQGQMPLMPSMYMGAPPMGSPQPSNMPSTHRPPTFRFMHNVRNRAAESIPGMVSNIGGMPGASPVGIDYPDPQAALATSQQRGAAMTDISAQKRNLGERLYPLISAHESELAGKITGMMLEMDNSELQQLLLDRNQLIDKIEEAKRVLQAHRGGLPADASP